MKTIAERLQEIPVEWAKDARNYYENDCGEYWIATIKGEVLMVTGLDIDFEVFTFNKEEAITASNQLLASFVTRSVPELNGIIFSKCEALWLLSIIEAFIYRT